MGKYKYIEIKRKKYFEKINDILDDLPSFCSIYRNAKNGFLSEVSLYTYLLHIKYFLEYLICNNSFVKTDTIKDISVDDLNDLTIIDIEKFLNHIRFYGNSDSAKTAENKKKIKNASVNHYLSALNSLWQFFVDYRMLDRNIIKDISRDKNEPRKVTAIGKEDSSELFLSVNNGKNLTKRQMEYRNDATIARDNAILLTLLKTGLKVSELVGLNIDDVDTQSCCFYIHKNNETHEIYFSDLVLKALEKYMSLRPLLSPGEFEPALFIVSVGKYKGRRLSVKGVQNLVKKYADAGAVNVRISPNSLRASFALDLLSASGGDLNLVKNAVHCKSPAMFSAFSDRQALILKANRNMLG